MLLGLLSCAADSVGQRERSERRPLPTLTKAHDVHSLTSEQAARNYPVHLRAVVTYYDPNIDPVPMFFVSDSSGAIYVSLSSPPAVPFLPGDLVEITGVSAAGDFAPIAKTNHAQLLGRSHLPPTAPRVTMTELLSGAQDGQWVEIEGLVHAVLKKATSVDVQLPLSDGALTATTADVGAGYDNLVDAKITLRGNAAPQFNHQQQ